MIKFTICKPVTITTLRGRVIPIGYHTEFVVALSRKTQRLSLKIKGYGFILTNHRGKEKMEDVHIDLFRPYYLDLPVYYPITFGFSLLPLRHYRRWWFYFFNKNHLWLYKVGNGLNTHDDFLKRLQRRNKKSWLRKLFLAQNK